MISEGYPMRISQGYPHVSNDHQGNPRASYAVPGSPGTAHDIVGHTNVSIHETHVTAGN